MEVNHLPYQCRVRRISLQESPNARTEIPDSVNCSFSDEDAGKFYIRKNVKIEIGKLLGAGGFGAVYEGKCLGRKIALKKLHRNTKNKHAVNESFLAEKVVLALKHRNIVRILAATEMSNLKTDKLVVMEFAGHKNLLNVINNENEKISKLRRLKFATDIVNALYFIHKLNIVHLDVKPANIMVTVHDTCKLGDFGCCKVINNGNDSPTTPTNSYLTGTLAYRSPELLKGEYPTCKADMYSYGICLWQLLVRKRPYGSENLYVVIFGVVSYQLRPNVANSLKKDNSVYVRLIEELWSANPEKRPSAMQVMDRLRCLRRRIQRSVKAHSNTRWKI